MADITNTTGSAGLSPSMQTYYDKKLIKDMKPKLVHCNYGQKRPIPRNAGKTVKFRKYTPFEAATTPLTEGVTPDGHAITQTEISATVAQYGDYVRVTDLLDMTAVDPVISDSVELNADQAALTLDTVVREVMCAGTNVMYANGTSRADVAAGNILTTTLIRKAVRTLKKAKARPFYRNGKPYFYAIVGPDTVSDPAKRRKLAEGKPVPAGGENRNGEIGKLFGVVFIETTESKRFATAGAGHAQVGGRGVHADVRRGRIRPDRHSGQRRGQDDSKDVPVGRHGGPAGAAFDDCVESTGVLREDTSADVDAAH